MSMLLVIFIATSDADDRPCSYLSGLNLYCFFLQQDSPSCGLELSHGCAIRAIGLDNINCSNKEKIVFAKILDCTWLYGCNQKFMTRNGLLITLLLSREMI